MIKHFVALQNIKIKIEFGIEFGNDTIIDNNVCFKAEYGVNYVAIHLVGNKNITVVNKRIFAENILPKCRGLTKNEIMIKDIIE